jgi:hypothetical protein
MSASDIFLSSVCVDVCTLVIIFEVWYYFLEVIFAKRGKDFFLVLFANNDMAECIGEYLINFYMEFISNNFSYIFELL